MTLTQVSSSTISAIGYEDGTLEIEFHHGGRYQYFDVPDTVHQELIEAHSHGKAFHQLIRGQYRFAKQEPAENSLSDLASKAVPSPQ